MACFCRINEVHPYCARFSHKVIINTLPWWLSTEESAPMQEMWVRSLGREDPLEKEMAIQLQYSCLGNPLDRGAW